MTQLALNRQPLLDHVLRILRSLSRPDRAGICSYCRGLFVQNVEEPSGSGFDRSATLPVPERDGNRSSIEGSNQRRSTGVEKMARAVEIMLQESFKSWIYTANPQQALN
jgi:hypothetical protein